MIRLASGLLSISLILVASTAASVWFLESWLDRPGPLSEPLITVLEPGTGIKSIASHLADVDAIDNPHLFALAVVTKNKYGPLQAGEYSFPERVKPRTILAALASGSTLVHKLTIPEGLTKSEIMEIVQNTAALSGEIKAVPKEGRLLPETYHFSRGDTRESMVTRMKAAMQDTLQALWSERLPNLPYSSPNEALIMASIIEEETGRASERARVAAVFVNRLRIDMLLQSDPTILYGITAGNGKLGRPLTRADLQISSPYNTYRYIGLPPGPITNPGKAAIAAALKPSETNELYFVADGNGGHRFARTLTEHNRNVARFRRSSQKTIECSVC